MAGGGSAAPQGSYEWPAYITDFHQLLLNNVRDTVIPGGATYVKSPYLGKVGFNPGFYVNKILAESGVSFPDKINALSAHIVGNSPEDDIDVMFTNLRRYLSQWDANPDVLLSLPAQPTWQGLTMPTISAADYPTVTVDKTVWEDYAQAAEINPEVLTPLNTMSTGYAKSAWELYSWNFVAIIAYDKAKMAAFSNAAVPANVWKVKNASGVAVNVDHTITIDKDAWKTLSNAPEHAVDDPDFIWNDPNGNPVDHTLDIDATAGTTPVTFDPIAIFEATVPVLERKITQEVIPQLLFGMNAAGAGLGSAWTLAQAVIWSNHNLDMSNYMAELEKINADLQLRRGQLALQGQQLLVDQANARTAKSQLALGFEQLKVQLNEIKTQKARLFLEAEQLGLSKADAETRKAQVAATEQELELKLSELMHQHNVLTVQNEANALQANIANANLEVARVGATLEKMKLAHTAEVGSIENFNAITQRGQLAIAVEQLKIQQATANSQIGETAIKGEQLGVAAAEVMSRVADAKAKFFDVGLKIAELHLQKAQMQSAFLLTGMQALLAAQQAHAERVKYVLGFWSEASKLGIDANRLAIIALKEEHDQAQAYAENDAKWVGEQMVQAGNVLASAMGAATPIFPKQSSSASILSGALTGAGMGAMMMPGNAIFGGIAGGLIGGIGTALTK